MILLNTSLNWNDILIASAVGTVVVFLGLTALIFAFKFTAYLSVRNSKKRMEKENNKIESNVPSKEISASEIAAISMALHMFFNEHDEESNIITIKRIEKRYSPWNSKIYGLNNNMPIR